jgi:hypothetical protein
VDSPTSGGEEDPELARSALALSEPWTMFSPMSVARSPRIVPGRRRDRVGRTHECPHPCDRTLTADRIATSGPDVMNSTSSPKNGRSTCSA